MTLNLALPASAQEEEPEQKEPAIKRRDKSDSASLKLIKNYLAVTGGAEAHNQIRNVVATGTLDEARQLKQFELIELRDGRRHLTLTWRHLGRHHKEVLVYDGVNTWRQVLLPKEKRPTNYGGQEGIHFSHQRWLLQPFVLPSSANYVFEYESKAKVLGRPCYVIVGYGKKNVRSWFYFDQKNFLLLRWEGLGQLANIREHMGYRATKFKKVDDVLFPSEINLLAQNQAYGSIQIDKIETNQKIDMSRFVKIEKESPVLRQLSKVN